MDFYFIKGLDPSHGLVWNCQSPLFLLAICVLLSLFFFVLSLVIAVSLFSLEVAFVKF